MTNMTGRPRRDCLLIVSIGWLFTAIGCGPIILPSGMERAAPPANIEDPEKYRVDSGNYPIFRVKERFEPPRRKIGTLESKYSMVAVETTDVWRVTHKRGETYLIHSDAYTDRQCRLLARIEPSGIAGGFAGLWGSNCSPDYLYHIWITLDGTVKGSGWKLLKNPKVTILARDRYINMQIDPATPTDWGSQPLFEPIR